jgi:hypothetical protein
LAAKNFARFGQRLSFAADYFRNPEINYFDLLRFAASCIFDKKYVAWFDASIVKAIAFGSVLKGLLCKLLNNKPYQRVAIFEAND